MSHKLLLFLFFLLSLPFILLADGRIKGKITDLQSGEPLIGANVVVTGTSFGASTDVNGEYVINNLDAGQYELKASYIGYQTVTLQNIRVSDQLTTDANFQLPAEGVTVQTVEIRAERPLVNPSNTNAIRTTTSEDIEALPVRGINNIISLTAGVVLQDNAVFIRGGRLDEVGYYLEGVSITNPITGGRAVTIPQDAVEEIQVQAGGYTAEFGGANAGIIRQQLKTGPKNWQASAEYITDNVGFQSKSKAFSGDKRLGAFWYGYNEAIATLGGPVFDERFRFFGLFNYTYQRDANPQPYPGINLGLVSDPTANDTINLSLPAGAVFGNSLQTYSYSATISMDLKPFIVRLAGTFSQNNRLLPYNTHRNPGVISNITNSGRIENLDTDDGSGSLKITHVINSNMFYEITGGYFIQTLHRYDPYLEDNFMAYGDSTANAAVGFTNFASAYGRPDRHFLYTFAFNGYGDVLSGYQKAKREDLSVTAALSLLVGKEHSFRIGGDFHRYTIRNYSWNNERVFSLAQTIHDNSLIPEGDPQKLSLEGIMINRGVNAYGYDAFGNETDAEGIFAPKHPVFASAYIQDRIEYSDLILNIGLRYDYIDTDNKELIDPAYPEKTFDPNTGDLVPGGLADVPSFNAISPRIGLSFPVTDRTVFHAQYGKFVQQTRLADIYQGLPATSSQLRGGLFIGAPIGFNVRPTRTTQYEIGFTQQIGDVASFDITGYYKDIRDQVILDLQRTGRPGEPNSEFQSYNVLINGDFATTKGLEVTFNLRRIERIAVNANLSFQDARGTGSFPNSNRGIVGAPIDGVTIFEPSYVSPLEFNNAFSGNVNVDYRFGEDDGPFILHGFGISLLGRFTSGHPFTRGVGGVDLEGEARDRRPVEPLNASRTPATFQVDLKVDKTFSLIDRLNANIYISVINLFDRRNVENVFLRTGSTTDDGWLSHPSNAGKFTEDYQRIYRAINIDYYQAYQNAPFLNTVPFFYGPPRQIRLGIRLEY